MCMSAREYFSHAIPYTQMRIRGSLDQVKLAGLRRCAIGLVCMTTSSPIKGTCMYGYKNVTNWACVHDYKWSNQWTRMDDHKGATFRFMCMTPSGPIWGFVCITTRMLPMNLYAWTW